MIHYGYLGTEKDASVFVLTDNADAAEIIEIRLVIADADGNIYAASSGESLNPLQNESWSGTWTYQSEDEARK